MTDSQMDAPELLPCPFCGGEAKAKAYIVDSAVWCCDCRSTLPRVNSDYGEYGLSEAIDAWNRRTPTVLATDPAVKALVEAAEARVWKLAAERLALAEHDAEERDWRSGANAFAALAKGFRAEAAAIRGETP